MMRYLRDRTNKNFEDLEALIRFSLREIVEVDGKRYYYYTLVLNHLKALIAELYKTSSLTAEELAGELPSAFVNHLSNLKSSIMISCQKNRDLHSSQLIAMDDALTQLIDELCQDIQLSRSFSSPGEGYAIGGTPLNERHDGLQDEDEIEMIRQDSNDTKHLNKVMRESGIRLRAEAAYDEKLQPSAPANLYIVSRQLELLKQNEGSFRHLYGLENSQVKKSSRKFVKSIKESMAETDRQLAAAREKKREEHKRNQQLTEGERMRAQIRHMQFNQRSSSVIQPNSQRLFGQPSVRQTAVPRTITNPFKQGL